MNTPWSSFNDLKKLLEVLSPALIVGGAVRNMILNKEINDIDIATSHPPEVVIKLAHNAGFYTVPTGLKHGTVTCIMDRPYEVTTLRVDTITNGRHAIVEFSDSWECDARRRDFTMNALYSTFEGHIHDFINGIDDARNGLVKFIGNPKERIQEDYLRILRFFRFYAHYGNTYDIDSLYCCTSLAPNLEKISRERCTAEFMKILSAKNALKALEIMSADIFRYSSLPAILPNTFRELDLSYHNLTLTPIARVATFSHHHRLILSKKQERVLTKLYELKNMYNLEEYVYWINSADPEILWDGIILRGKNNDQVVPDLDKWLQNRFNVTGKDLIELGMEQGPQINQELKRLKLFFCRQTSPPSREIVLAEALNHVKNIS